jgi:hypothetical protein
MANMRAGEETMNRRDGFIFVGASQAKSLFLQKNIIVHLSTVSGNLI